MSLDESCPSCGKEWSKGWHEREGIAYKCPNGHIWTTASKVIDALRHQLADAEELLKELEWADYRCVGLSKCPTCQKAKYRGHSPDCKLDAWLKGNPS